MTPHTNQKLRIKVTPEGVQVWCVGRKHLYPYEKLSRSPGLRPGETLEYHKAFDDPYWYRAPEALEIYWRSKGDFEVSGIFTLVTHYHPGDMISVKEVVEFPSTRFEDIKGIGVLIDPVYAHLYTRKRRTR